MVINPIFLFLCDSGMRRLFCTLAGGNGTPQTQLPWPTCTSAAHCPGPGSTLLISRYKSSASAWSLGNFPRGSKANSGQKTGQNLVPRIPNYSFNFSWGYTLFRRYFIGWYFQTRRAPPTVPFAVYTANGTSIAPVSHIMYKNRRSRMTSNQLHYRRFRPERHP